VARKHRRTQINNVVYISDTHSGCSLALCPPDGVQLDDGGRYMPSDFQLKMWAMWEEFWGEWVPEATRGEPFAVVHNGDAVEGVHHGSKTQITNNLTVHSRIAYAVLGPVVEQCEGRYYHIRGTEAHVGKSAEEEEALAESLGAIPNPEGQYARYDLWKEVGGGGELVHSLHHIGTTSSNAYEATAPHKELVEMYTEAGRWGDRPPMIAVRSHRHRHIETSIPTAHGKARVVVTPAWQGKTPFSWKIAGARITTPQFGGVLVRWSEDKVLFTKEKIWPIARSQPE
jgi:hypothetical protein